MPQFLFTLAVLLGMLSYSAATPGRVNLPQALGRDLAGAAVDPIRNSHGKIAVLIFIRPDCPISNRYAPVLGRMSREQAARAAFWLVYPASSLTSAAISAHRKAYGYSIPALRDPAHALTKLAQAKVTPETAVFAPSGALVYHGRIDNWYQDFGRARPAATSHELADAIAAEERGEKPEKPFVPAVGCYIADLE